jgi:hypothetical protein
MGRRPGRINRKHACRYSGGWLADDDTKQTMNVLDIKIDRLLE